MVGGRKEGTSRERSRVSGALGPRGRGVLSKLFGDKRESRAPKREAAVIAVASGKGGTGKSFFSTSLAVMLHRAGRRVSVVDCDFGLACDHLLLGVNPKLTLRHVLSGQIPVEEIRLATPAGPTLVPGASGVRQMASLSDQELLTFGRTLGVLARDGSDVLILDMGAGIAPQNVLTLTAADHVVLVTQPEIAALTDAYAVCKNLTQIERNADIAVVVNRVVEPGQGSRAFAKLESVMQKFTGLRLHFLGEIGEDPTVTQRRLGQLPIVATDADTATTRALHSIRDHIVEMMGPLEPRLRDAGQDIESRFTEHRLFL